ncbi:MAG: class I tRNA ligase family protein, partial [Chlorobi bacterium]|nr:class I tRNA ligase family protein [Chlorobiota bacterium]
MGTSQHPVKEIPKAYDPSLVEEKWYAYWERHKVFHAEPEPDKEQFVVLMPPPNITGMLHMGHVLNHTLQDIYIRWYRMEGKNTVWIPGTDHAGIATQTVVEKSLREEGKTRHDLGREKFLEKVWEWRDQFGSIILQQLRKLGVSADWDRLVFTMDEKLSRAVREVFVRLYEKGLIYR